MELNLKTDIKVSEVSWDERRKQAHSDMHRTFTRSVAGFLQDMGFHVRREPAKQANVQTNEQALTQSTGNSKA